MRYTIELNTLIPVRSFERCTDVKARRHACEAWAEDAIGHRRIVREPLVCTDRLKLCASPNQQVPCPQN